MSHSQLQVLFLLTMYSFSIFGCTEYNQYDFGFDHLVMSMYRGFSCVVGRGCLLWPEFAFFWQNSISLCPASFCTPRPNLPVTPGVSWLPTFAFHFPIMKRTSFLGVLEGLVGLHKTIQLQLLQHYCLRHRLGLPWYWMVCLGNEQRSFCRFWDCIQVLHFRLFCWLWWLLLPLKKSVCSSGTNS